jgi:hypothetical protein
MPGAALDWRPPIAPELEKTIRAALDKPGRAEGVRKIAALFGVDPATVQRISPPRAKRRPCHVRRRAEVGHS